MLKRIMGVLLALTLIMPCGANAEAAYQLENKTNIASGVTLTNLKRLDSAGWQNINIIEADLSNPYVAAKILTSSKGMNTLETVETLSKENNTVAAINGDFFAWNSSDSSKGSAVGTIMNNGELLSSSSETEGMFTFAIDEFNKIICENIKTNITLTAANGNVLTIKHLNKYDSLAQPVIYTSAFGGVTGGSYNNILEVVIVDDVVTEMRREQDGVEIPENGYVIRHLPEFDPFLTENLAVGDEVEIKFDANFDLSSFKTMTGGGTMLVTQGQLAKNTHNISGTNPRTAIACDETRTKLYLITVDGRQNQAKGYTLSQFADFLIEYGMYDAMNLDGGGSTTMVTKQNGSQKVTNVPSDGGQRKVATGVGVLSDAPKGTMLAGFDIDVSDDKVFSGTSRKFSIKNSVDEYGNPFEGNIPEINWSVENGYGYFDGNILHAEKSGKNIKVYASYNGYTAEKEIDILDEISELVISPSHFRLGDFENPEFSVTAKNNKGISAIVESEDIGIVYKNDYEKAVNVLNKSKTITFSDIICEFEGNEFTADKYPSDATSSAAANYENFKSGRASAMLKFDFSAVTGDKTGAAYLKFKSPVNVSSISKMGVWVYSPTVLNQWLRAEFKDSSGNVLRQTLAENVDFSGWKYMTFEVPDGATELTQLYVVQNELQERAGGYILFDSLSATSYEFEAETVINKPSSLQNGDISFSVMGNMPELNTFLTKILVSKTAANLKNDDYVFSLSNYDFSGIDEITTKSYSSFKKDLSLFITLNNSDGYTSGAQWIKFDNDTSGSFKNLFIFLNESPGLIVNQYEKNMFMEKLEVLSEKADVFVFYPDMHTGSYYDSGACFVSVGNLTTLSPKSAVKLSGNMLFPRITVTNNKASLSYTAMY